MGWLPLLALILEGPCLCQGFGKYLQAHADKINRNSQAPEDNVAAVVQSEGQHQPSHNEHSSSIIQRSTNFNYSKPEETDLEIEVAAAILLAGIFVAFILIYTVFLQCWWQFRECRSKQKAKASSMSASSAHSNGFIVGSQCLCLAQKAWEPMDVNQHFLGKIESITNGPDGTKIVTLTTTDSTCCGKGGTENDLVHEPHDEANLREEKATR